MTHRWLATLARRRPSSSSEGFLLGWHESNYQGPCVLMSTMFKKQEHSHKKFGLLKPLQIPSGPWNSLSMDFITQLPLSAQIFISHVFSKHGLPISIFSDRAYGQTERVNQILEQYPWMYVSYHQDDWHTCIPLAEFAYNNAEHSSTKQSRFFTIYGRNPNFDLINMSQDTPAG
ncbi:hypothetical protein O181_063005 [Austropuccinia psidii MF-1]|uniref:Integrase catalytic domain-containing protein n=1 Tax=Austropuccinia psidii MF-1 TaxID=1389203 RepID=A0A9Q3EI09_9BASI|nr:hypothetical protein [Austropuccinia psidii MF-1]